VKGKRDVKVLYKKAKSKELKIRLVYWLLKKSY